MNFLIDSMPKEVHRPEVGLIAPPKPKKQLGKMGKMEAWIKEKWLDVRIRYYTAEIAQNGCKPGVKVKVIYYGE